MASAPNPVEVEDDDDGAGEGNEVADDAVAAVLRAVGLHEVYYERLRDFGIDSLDDLRHFSDADATRIGIKALHLRKIRTQAEKM